LASWVHSHQRLRIRGTDWGVALRTLFENTGIPAVPAIDAQPPKKRSWLPLLTVLFLISYGLMTMLIVEQGATIESQRALIRELFRDSTELSALKVKAAQQEMRRANPSAKTQIQSNQTPSNQVQTPSTQIQVPSKQAPSYQVPSSPAATQRRAMNQTDKQKQFQPPSRPASDLADARRELRKI
jgi:hypothetical protein